MSFHISLRSHRSRKWNPGWGSNAMRSTASNPHNTSWASYRLHWNGMRAKDLQVGMQILGEAEESTGRRLSRSRYGGSDHLISTRLFIMSNPQSEGHAERSVWVSDR